MSFVTRTAVVEPPAPSGSNKFRQFIDIADGREKLKDANGLVYTISNSEWPKNQLINGGFNFAQRQVPGTLTSRTPGVAARAYGADRWFVSNEANDTQYQQIDTIAAPETNILHRYYGKLKKITAVGKVLTGQIMTAENMAPLRGRKVRIQCLMKRNNAMTVRLGLAQLAAAGTHDVIAGYVAGAPSGTFVSAWGGSGVDPTLAANITRLTPVALSNEATGTIVGDGLNCILTTTWQRFSVCFTVPIDAKNLIFMVWTDQQLAVNDELNMAQCVLVDGMDVVDWISMPQVYELDRCSRFYCKSFPLAVAPAQNAGVAGSVRYPVSVAGAVGTSWSGADYSYPVPMRATPTLTLFNPSAVNAFVRNITLGTDATVTAGANGCERSTHLNCTGLAAWAVGNDSAVHLTADAEL